MISVFWFSWSLKVTYYPDNEVDSHLRPVTNRVKKEPITAMLLSSPIVVGVVEAVETGSAALVLQDRNYKNVMLA